MDVRGSEPCIPLKSLVSTKPDVPHSFTIKWLVLVIRNDNGNWLLCIKGRRLSLFPLLCSFCCCFVWDFILILEGISKRNIAHVEFVIGAPISRSWRFSHFLVQCLQKKMFAMSLFKWLPSFQTFTCQILLFSNLMRAKESVAIFSNIKISYLKGFNIFGRCSDYFGAFIIVETQAAVWCFQTISIFDKLDENMS